MELGRSQSFELQLLILKIERRSSGLEVISKLHLGQAYFLALLRQLDVGWLKVSY